MEVLKDEYFPADLLLLSSDNMEGICYIESMNLDGETNLKIKKACNETKGLSRSTVSSFKVHSCPLLTPLFRLPPPRRGGG